MLELDAYLQVTTAERFTPYLSAIPGLEVLRRGYGEVMEVCGVVWDTAAPVPPTRKSQNSARKYNIHSKLRGQHGIRTGPAPGCR